MTTQTIETQFVIEIPSELKPFVERYSQDFHTAICTGLGVLFGLPFGALVQLSARYTNRFQLNEVNGKVNRVPEELEIQGMFVGVQAALLAIHQGSASVIDLKGGRVTDA